MWSAVCLRLRLETGCRSNAAIEADSGHFGRASEWPADPEARAFWLASWSLQLCAYRNSRRLFPIYLPSIPCSTFITTDDWHTEHFIRPVVMCCAMKNAKVITVALGYPPTPYRLASRLSLCNLEHHPSSKQWATACFKVSTCSSRSSRLSSSSSPTSPPFTADLLANVRAFVLCSLFSSLTDRLTPLPRFGLHGSGTAVVSSTVAATLHAPIGHVCCRQGRRRGPPQDEIESITLPDTTTQVLGRPAAGDASAVAA